MAILALNVCISHNNNEILKLFRFSLFYVHYFGWIKPKTISRYCPFKGGGGIMQKVKDHRKACAEDTTLEEYRNWSTI